MKWSLRSLECGTSLAMTWWFLFHLEEFWLCFYDYTIADWLLHPDPQSRGMRSWVLGNINRSQGWSYHEKSQYSQKGIPLFCALFFFFFFGVKLQDSGSLSRSKTPSSTSLSSEHSAAVRMCLSCECFRIWYSHQRTSDS